MKKNVSRNEYVEIDCVRKETKLESKATEVQTTKTVIKQVFMILFRADDIFGTPLRL